jgi:hypothetical protein
VTGSVVGLDVTGRRLVGVDVTRRLVGLDLTDRFVGLTVGMVVGCLEGEAVAAGIFDKSDVEGAVGDSDGGKSAALMCESTRRR